MFKSTLIGHVAQDLETRTVKSGDRETTVSSGLVIVNVRKNGTEEQVLVRISCWDKYGMALAQHAKAGRQVYIEGQLLYDAETGSPKVFTRKDGTPGASFELRVSGYELLGRKPENKS